MVGALILENGLTCGRWQSESRMLEIEIMKSSRYDHERLAKIRGKNKIFGRKAVKELTGQGVRRIIYTSIEIYHN